MSKFKGEPDGVEIGASLAGRVQDLQGAPLEANGGTRCTWRKIPLMAASHPNNSSMKQQSLGRTGIAQASGLGVPATSLRRVAPAAAVFMPASHPFPA